MHDRTDKPLPVLNDDLGLSRRDQEWVIAMATALGTNSGLRVPIVPDARSFRELFEAIAARERESIGKLPMYKQK